jgi:hypothetical protein
MIDKIWKLDWTPQGVEETFSIDTTRLVSGDIIPLKRTFFKGRGIKVLRPDGRAVIVSDSDDRAGAILYNKDARLSALAEEPIYQSLKLNVPAVGTILTITAFYVADQISSQSFDQDLTPYSNVEHMSLSTFLNYTREQYSQFARVDERLELPNGYITSKETCLPGVVTFQNVTFRDSAIHVDDKETGLYCSSGHLRYDKDSGAWVRSLPSKREAPLLSFHDGEAPAGGIPLVNQGDKSTLTCVDWFKTDPDNKKVVVKHLQAQTATVEEAHTGSLSIGNHTLTVLANGELNIDNALRINRTTGTISIGFITLTVEKLHKLARLLEDRS